MADWLISDERARGILLAEGKLEEVAERFGVSHVTVSLYKNGRLAKARRAIARLHAEGLEVVQTMYKESGSRRFTDEQVAAIRASDEPSGRLARHYGCSPAAIRMIRTGRTYK